MSLRKKQTPICNEGVAPFNEIRKDKDIKFYPVAPQFVFRDTYPPIGLAYVASSLKARWNRCYEIESATQV